MTQTAKCKSLGIANYLCSHLLLGLLDSNRDLGQLSVLAGPTTAAGMAAAKGWRNSIVPSLLVGTLGYAMATFLAVALGINILQKM